MPSKFEGLTIDDTGSITLPSGTDAQRLSYTEQVVQFTTAGADSWTVPSGVHEAEVLVVAGGGGGASGLGSGGGAGGVLYEPSYKVTPGESLYVFVGAGGAGGPDNTNAAGSNGQNSKFGSLEAIGGGGGSSEASDNGSSGGSGGGSSSTNPRLEIRHGATNGQGHAGGVTEYGPSFGYVQGSGGGAGGPATLGTKGNFSLPGPGLQFNITGAPKWYGGGGAGAAYGDALSGGSGKGAGLDGALGGGGNGGLSGDSTNARLAGDATSNTGGGGGGGPEGISAEGGGNLPGGNGGSGIVVIRYYQDSDSESPYGHIRNNSATNSVETFRSGYWKSKDIVTDGLILRAEAENYISGSTWTDTSGNSNNITLYNSPSKRNGNIPSLYFDENLQQYWDTTITNVGQPGTSFTAAGWVKYIATGDKQDNYFLMSTYTTASNTPFWAIAINYNGGNVYGWARGGGGTPNVQMDPYTTIEPGKWYYYTFVRDNSNNAIAFYINGRQVQAEIFPGGEDLNDNNEPFGGIRHSTASFMSAEMGAVHLYDRALDNVEVLQNFEAQKKKYKLDKAKIFAKTKTDGNIPKGGLVFHLDANDPTSFPDPSRNGTWLDLINSKEVRISGPQWDTANGIIKYLDFDGSDDTAFMPDVITSYPLTASFWCTHNNGFSPDSGQQDELMNFSIGGQRLSLGCANNVPSWSQIGCTIMYGGTSHWTTSRTSPVDMTSGTKWFNITYVIHGNNDRNHQIYINGMAPPMVDEGGGHGGNPGARLGSNSDGGENWPGKIAKVMLYNRVLDSHEVNQIYQSTRWRFGA